ncbi:9639_t:CDS:1, partial [Gigaspora margarita]
MNPTMFDQHTIQNYSPTDGATNNNLHNIQTTTNNLSNSTYNMPILQLFANFSYLYIVTHN